MKKFILLLFIALLVYACGGPSYLMTRNFDKYYNSNDDKESWFNNMKLACEELGYCSNMKLYKENPSDYKGSIADFSMILRVALTTKSTTPDLYEIMKLLGIERIKYRITL